MTAASRYGNEMVAPPVPVLKEFTKSESFNARDIAPSSDITKTVVVIQ